MDAGPLTASRSPPSWQLADPVAAATQGFVVTGFGALPTGRALFLEFTWPGRQGTRWLAEPVAGRGPDHQRRSARRRRRSDARGVHCLQRHGPAAHGIGGGGFGFFRVLFQGGHVPGGSAATAGRQAGRPMARLRRGWRPCLEREHAPACADVVLAERVRGTAGRCPAEQCIPTEITVHALLLLYAKDEPAADAWAEHVRIQLLQDGVALVRGLKLLLDVENGGFSREHFGFADALSQPLPYDEANAVQVGGQPAKQDPVQGVPLGEFMFGHINGHHEKAPGPVVAVKRRGAQGRTARLRKGRGVPRPGAERQLSRRARAQAGRRRVLAIDGCGRSFHPCAGSRRTRSMSRRNGWPSG